MICSTNDKRHTNGKTYEETLLHGFSWLADGLWQSSDQLGGFFSIDFLGFDPLHDLAGGWSGTGIGDGVTVGLPCGVALAGFLALVVGLWGVQLAGGFLDLLGAHGADQFGQNVEFVQSVGFWEFIWILQVLADFLGQFLGLVHGVDLLGHLDRLTLEANEIWQQWVLRGILQVWLWLEEFLAAVD